MIDYAILCFGSLFVIVDAIGLVPAFVTMTREHTREERVRTAAFACTVSFFILALFAVSGPWPFKIFGITLPAFEIAGGVLLAIVALDMLQARRTAVKETPEEQAAGVRKEEIGITPLAIPMLAGPGAITDVILLGNRASSLTHHAVLLAAIFLVCFISFLILRLAAVRPAILGVIALKISTRLMGLVLSAIAVQFILNGIREARLAG